MLPPPLMENQQLVTSPLFAPLWHLPPKFQELVRLPPLIEDRKRRAQQMVGRSAQELPVTP